MKRSKGERMFSVFNYTFLVLLAFVALYPFAYVVFASLSDPVKIMSVKELYFGQ